MDLDTLRIDQTGVIAPTQSWLTLNQSMGGVANPVMQFVFDTPIPSTSNPTPNQCGRVLYNEYHVENGSSSTGKIFPNECNTSARDDCAGEAAGVHAVRADGRGRPAVASARAAGLWHPRLSDSPVRHRPLPGPTTPPFRRLCRWWALRVRISTLRRTNAHRHRCRPERTARSRWCLRRACWAQKRDAECVCRRASR